MRDPVMAKAKPDTRIISRGRGHSYLLDGEKVDGVTTVTGNGVPKPQLIKWAAEQTWKYAIDHWDELSGLPPSERISRMEGARWDHLREASERGTEVHKQIERYLAGEPVVPPAGLEGHVDAAIRFVEEWRLEELVVEAPIFSRTFGYAGRPDTFARLADGNLWLLDWKTHAKGPFVESALQLAAYRYADFYVLDGDVDDEGRAVEHPMPRVDRTGIVHVKADEALLYPFDAGPDAFEVFGAVQQVAAFVNSARESWIGDALRPPALEEKEVA
jgi:hypothetical protein